MMNDEIKCFLIQYNILVDFSLMESIFNKIKSKNGDRKRNSEKKQGLCFANY